MSDMGFSDVEGAAHNPAAPADLTAGAMMRNAREAAGLHVAALAVSMKIPVKKLEALEADRLDLLHDAVFVRALAASVCRALKIDPAPVLGKLPLNTTPKLNPDEGGINAPFHAPGDTSSMLSPALFTKPSTLAAMALVLAGIAVFFFPDIRIPDWSNQLSTQTTRTGAESSDATPPAKEVEQAFPDSSSGTVTAPNLSNGAATELVVQAPAAAVAASTATSTTATSTPPAARASVSVAPPQPPASQALAAVSRPVAGASRPVAVASAPAVAASRPASVPVLPSTGTVVFKARGTTWVKVVDAKGVVQLSKTLAEGEIVGASGAMPLSVVVGRVDATEVEVRGQAFNLTGVSRENVARFEVK